jgi:transcription elongation factor GreA
VIEGFILYNILYNMAINTKKIYLTPKGLEELKKELEELVKVTRPEVVRRLSSAREMGDLSENAEYTAARDELSFIDGRIEELEILLKQVVLITDGHHGQIIDLGSQVTVHVKGREENFMLVGEWEADPMEKKISHESPLGKALIGKVVGDEVQVEAPAGTVAYKIVSVS